MKPQLYIDSNERGTLCESIERKAKKAGLVVARKPLVVGDYLLGGACVEAKSVGDLFQSSHSGHLWRQLDNMDANYERFFIVVHGTVEKYLAMARNNGRAKLTYSKVRNDLRLDMIMTVPGIGQETAEKLLEKCGSIEEMCFPESIKKVKGLGDVRRKMLVDILTSEEPVRQERKVRR